MPPSVPHRIGLAGGHIGVDKQIMAAGICDGGCDEITDFGYRFAFRRADVHRHAGFLTTGGTVGVGVFLAELAGDRHFDVAAPECGEALFGDLLLQRHQTVEPTLRRVVQNLLYYGGRRVGA